MLDPWVKKIPWSRAWQPTPVFLPVEACGQRSLVGYSPWSCKELDTTVVTVHTRRQALKDETRTRLGTDPCELLSLGKGFGTLSNV